MTEQEIEKRMKSFTPEYKTFVSSDFTAIAADTYAKSYELNKNQELDFKESLMKYLTFIYSKEEFIQDIKVKCGLNESLAGMILDDILEPLPTALLESMELTRDKYNNSETGNFSDSSKNLKTGGSQSPPPIPPKQPIPQAKPGIVANKQEKVVPEGREFSIKDKKAPIPTGKMVSIPKAESSIKGMRTMQGDISKLRGPESVTTEETNDQTKQDQSGSLQKPFPGKK